MVYRRRRWGAYIRRRPRRAPYRRRRATYAMAVRRTGRGRNWPVAAVARGLRAPMPRLFRTKLIYSDFGEDSAAATSVADTVVYRANSVFDPEFAVGGRQPTGYDQLAAMFNVVTVIASKITFRVTQGFQNLPLIYGITSSAVSASINSGTENMEQPYTITSSQAHEPKALTHSFSTIKDFGVRNALNDDALQHLVAGNPAREWFFRCFVFTPQSASAVGYNYQVLIEYDVIFSEPKTMQDV